MCGILMLQMTRSRKCQDVISPASSSFSLPHQGIRGHRHKACRLFNSADTSLGMQNGCSAEGNSEVPSTCVPLCELNLLGNSAVTGASALSGIKGL